jgi:hypothetical protein
MAQQQVAGDALHGLARAVLCHAPNDGQHTGIILQNTWLILKNGHILRAFRQVRNGLALIAKSEMLMSHEERSHAKDGSFRSAAVSLQPARNACTYLCARSAPIALALTLPTGASG